MRVLADKETFHRRAHGVVRTGSASEGRDPARRAGHPVDHAALRRVGRVRQTGPVADGDYSNETRRVRSAARTGGSRLPGTLADMPEVATANRDRRLRQNSRSYRRSQRYFHGAFVRAISQLGEPKFNTTGTQRTSSGGTQASVPLPNP